MEYTIKAPVTIPAEHVYEMLMCADVGYWLDELSFPRGAAVEEGESPWRWAVEGNVVVAWVEGRRYMLGPDQMHRGLRLLATQHRLEWQELLSEDWDGWTGDIFPKSHLWFPCRRHGPGRGRVHGGLSTRADETDTTRSNNMKITLEVTPRQLMRLRAALGRYHRRGQAGLDLIEAYEDPMERRRKLLRLTPKGKRRMEGITNQLAGGLS